MNCCILFNYIKNIYPNDWELNIDLYVCLTISNQAQLMLELPYTSDNIILIQEFLDKTRKRISEGVKITFTRKANLELQDLVLDFEMSITEMRCKH